MPPHAEMTAENGVASVHSDDMSPSKSLANLETLPAVAPQVGGVVLSAFGQGTIVQMDPTKVQVELSTWDLANSSKVHCFLSLDSILVLAEKSTEDMTAPELLHYTTVLRAQANALQSDLKYGAAFEFYKQAVALSTKLLGQQDIKSNERADLLVRTVKSCNDVGGCAIYLHRWQEALEHARTCVALLDAVVKRGGGEAGIVSPQQQVGQVRLGECRVKAYIIMAKAWNGMGQPDKVAKKCDIAQGIITEYVNTKTLPPSLVKKFVSYQRKIKRIRREGKEKKVVAGQTPYTSKSRKVWFAGETKPGQKDAVMEKAQWRPATVVAYSSLLAGALFCGYYVVSKQLARPRK
jgi:hypothetical protein